MNFNKSNYTLEPISHHGSVYLSTLPQNTKYALTCCGMDACGAEGPEAAEDVCCCVMICGGCWVRYSKFYLI